jgi:hypothetical protein
VSLCKYAHFWGSEPGWTGPDLISRFLCSPHNVCPAAACMYITIYTSVYRIHVPRTLGTRRQTRKRNAVHNVHSTSRLINYSRRGPPTRVTPRVRVRYTLLRLPFFFSTSFHYYYYYFLQVNGDRIPVRGTGVF